MTQAEQFIRRLADMKAGERSILRRLAGRSLDHETLGFDVFTGIWWPLRQKSKCTPRREMSWLVAKLYGVFSVPHTGPTGPRLAQILGRLEPRDERGAKRFRGRFDALLQSPLSGLEPHLRWAVSVVGSGVGRARGPGLDWAQLLDDLSIWDRGEEHRRERNVRDIWAEQYLNAVHQSDKEVYSAD